MKHLLMATLLICSMIAFAQAQGTAAKKESISGAWILNEQFPDETHAHRMTLEVNGDKIMGQSGPSKIEGAIEGEVITLKWLTPDGRVDATYTGRVQGDMLKGEGDWGGLKLQWSALRPASRTGGPQTHTFTPTEFHRVFSYAIPPALRIFPGDTVKTKSVDAGGSDENSVRRSQGGNPLTGPFYVEGAIPGDTLVIKLNRVRTNRDWAQSGQGIVGNALAPGYLMNLKRAQNFSSRWKIDAAKGVAYLDKPTDPLKPLTIPLQPMMGCVGVAPPGRDVVRTGDSGVFGGNMDYNQIREGTTVYLPVFQAGALLFMGDGHAAQGDGELTGDALETSMDFEFTVDVIKEKSIGTPRAENDEYIMAIGIGGSLDQALQRATTEMARWLENDFKLNSTEAAMILGFAVKYDVADLVGTQVSIVAKIPKTVLAQLKRQ
jgi:acetamidase/formamidase